MGKKFQIQSNRQCVENIGDSNSDLVQLLAAQEYPTVSTDMDTVRDEDLHHQEKSLDREFEQLFVGSIMDGMDARRLEKKPQAFETSLPFHLKSSSKSTYTDGNDQPSPMKILLKRKNKPITREISISSCSGAEKNTQN